MSTVRIVAISDTHNYHKSVTVPPCDILVHAGDSTSRGYKHEVEDFGNWLRSLDQCTHKVCIAGNHDRSFEDTPTQAREWLYGHMEPGTCGVHYLQDEEIVLNVGGRDVRIYGSPWQPFFCNWAFNLKTPEELKAKWDLIPKGLDCLVTHGPPYKLLDKTSYGNEHVGCRELRKAIQRTKPKLHVVGHIHEGYGVARFGNTLVSNASSCTVRYNPTNPPLLFELDDDGTMRQAPQAPRQETTKEWMSHMSDSLFPYADAPSASPSATAAYEDEEAVPEKEEDEEQ